MSYPEKYIALVGNPNSGKTTLFNALTGLNQKTSNFPGTTVELHKARLHSSGTQDLFLIDLPGTYSIYPKSADERVTVELLLSPERKPDLVVVVADASHLKRSLLLTTQVIDLGFPVVMALNMLDVAGAKGMETNPLTLSKELGVKVVDINARKKQGLDELKKAMEWEIQPALPFHPVHPAINEFLDELSPVFGDAAPYRKLIRAHQVADTVHQKQNIHRIYEKYQFNASKEQARETLARFKKIDEVVAKVQTRELRPDGESLNSRIDRVLTHPIWGLCIFLVTLFFLFQSIFFAAQYPMDAIEQFFVDLGSWTRNMLPDTWWSGLLVNGVIAGMGGVFVFLPQIAILFAFISLLEDSGYMARVSFLMDKMLRRFGLNGKSIVPLMGGVACAVPSIMATRNIENARDRLITLMVIPLMSCSARLPVYTLLISFLAPDTKVWGILNMQGIFLFAMYVLGFVSALIVAWVFHIMLKKNKGDYFVFELPGYKVPSWQNLKVTVVDRCRAFLLDAGKIIVLVSVILWFLGSYGSKEKMEKVDQWYQGQLASGQADTAKIELEYGSKKLEASYAGTFGRWLEPIIEPLGFNWRMGIALLSSFAAREVFVGTMATIYSLEDEQDTGIREKMRAEKDDQGNPVYTPAVAMSLLIFYAFALQCISTIAVVKRETRTWKWPLIQLGLFTALAYLASFAAFQIMGN